MVPKAVFANWHPFVQIAQKHPKRNQAAKYCSRITLERRINVVENSPINKQSIISACVPPTKKKCGRKKKKLSSTGQFIVFSILRSQPVGNSKC